MHPLTKTILHRLGLGFVTLFLVSLIIFSAVVFLPGDFAQAILGRSATPEAVASFQKKLGLDRPAPERYADWIGGILHGDFGNSLSSGSGPDAQRTVMSIIGPRLENTFLLAGVTALIAVPLALLLGILAAIYRGGWFDRAVNAATLITISFPEFFTAYILMLFLAVKFPIFYSLSRITPDMGFIEMCQRMALPVLTLILGIIAHMMRMTRAAIIGVLASPYIEMARLKGVPPWRVILKHALPNAWAPIASVVAFNLAYLVVGVVIVEVVFVFPGIGQAMVEAVRTRDMPVVQACALIFAATYILLNLIADIIGIASNPRLLHPR